MKRAIVLGAVLLTFTAGLFSVPKEAHAAYYWKGTVNGQTVCEKYGGILSADVTQRQTLSCTGEQWLREIGLAENTVLTARPTRTGGSQADADYYSCRDGGGSVADCIKLLAAGTVGGGGLKPLAEAGKDWVKTEGAKLAGEFLSLILFVIQSTLLGLLYLVGDALNWVIDQLVLGMGSYVTGIASVGIQAAWTVIRDLANILIISALVATAFGTILQIDAYDVRKLLARIVVAALLVNFSYFAAGVIIDGSNLLAATIYRNAVIGRECTNPLSTNPGPGASVVTFRANCNIADRIMAFTNPQKLMSKEYSNLFRHLIKGEGSAAIFLIINYICIIALILPILFVFLNFFALLVTRFVILVILLITSPIGIAGYAFPYFNKYAKEWWSNLFQQAFFAPIFFLLIAFAFKILDGTLVTLAATAAEGSPFTAILGLIMSVVITVAFMFVALQAATRMSKATGELSKTGEFITKYAQAPVKYGYAVVARETAGRWAHELESGYREFAGRNRLDRIPIIRSFDRSFQSTLKKITEKDFGGYDSYHKEHEARKLRERELGEVEREQNLYARTKGLTGDDLNKYNGLKNKKSLTEAEKKSLALLERVKTEGGWYNVMQNSKKRHTDEYFEGIQRAGESNGDYEKRQQARGEWGIKGKFVRNEKTGKDEWKGEDLAAYDDRLDSMTGHQTSRGEMQAINAALPEDFAMRQYDKHPELLIELAESLPEEQFNTMMKDTKIRRDIKNKMREKRYGQTFGMIQDLHDRVERGEITAQSGRYYDLASAPYRRFERYGPRREGFLDAIQSGPFEKFREYRETWDGSSMSGQFIHARDKFGPTHQRDIEDLKQRAYSEGQNQWHGGMVIMGFKPGDPELPEEGGSDNYHSRDLAVEYAKRTIEETQKVIDNPNAHAEDKEYAKEKQRYAEMIVDPGKTGITNEVERKAKIMENLKKLYEIRDSNMSDDAKRASYDKIKEDSNVGFVASKIFDNEGGIDGKSGGMPAYRKGKNIEEVTAIPDWRKDAYSPFFVQGLTFDELAGITRDGKLDIRHIDALKANAFVYKSDDDIAQFSSSPQSVQAFGGWPSREQIDVINKRRRERNPNATLIPYKPSFAGGSGGDTNVPSGQAESEPEAEQETENP